LIIHVCGGGVVARLTWFVRRGKRVWAWKEGGRFVKAPQPDWKKKIFTPKRERVVRVTVGWSGGIQKKYKSMTWQKWVKNTEEDIASAKREGRKWVKEQVQSVWGKQYGKGSWWDFMKPGGAAEQRGAKDVFNEAVDSVVGVLGEVYSDVAEWER